MVDGRRGTATVLFTDLVGSTALRSELGEAAADDLRRSHDAALSEVVVERGGVVIKSIGDGIMATFGSAADAIEAGVAAQQAVSRLAGDLGIEIRIRVGISAGDVSWEDGDCFGLPVVEAARLEAAAEPGQILCSAVVQALAGGRVDVALEPVGDLLLKGLDAPVSAFSVPWSPLGGPGPVVEPFAGRGDALRGVAGLVEGVLGGVGSTLLVGGEPGAGKTRLVTEALRSERRVDVVWGHSFGGEVIPLGPVVEILDSLATEDPVRLRRCASHHDRVVAELSLAAAAAWVDVVEPDDIDLVEARQRLHSAVAETLAAWAVERPLVVVFDDLHWADELSVSVFRALARRARTSPLLVAGTYRPTDLDRRHPWGEALSVLVREVDPTQIDLDGLSVDEIGELVAVLAGQGLDPELVKELATASGGNPLFVLEISRQLAESGAFQRDTDGLWHRVEAVPLDLPRGLRQVIGGRVGRLDEDAQDFLAVASMFDAPFELGLVAELADMSVDVALGCVEAAQRARLVEATAQFDVYAFSHAMVRQTLYEEANPSRVVRLHRSIAKAIEARLDGTATDAQAAALAHHYACSAVMPGAEAGARWAAVAALAARDGGAFADAVRFVSIAEDLTDDPAELPANLRVAKAEAHAAMAEVEATRAACVDAAALLDETAIAGLYAACARGLDAAGANLADVWDFAAEGIQWCGDRRDESWLTLRNYELFGIEMRDPDYIGMPTDSPEKQELGAVATRIGSSQIVRYIHRDRAQILSHPHPNGVALALHAGELERAARVLDEHVGYAKRNGLAGEELVYRGIMMRVLHALGDIDRQQQVLDEGLSLYERTPWANATVQFQGGIAIPRAVFNPPAPDQPAPAPHPDLGSITNGRVVDLFHETLSSSTEPSLLFVKASGLALTALSAAIYGKRNQTLDCLESALPALVAGPAGSTNYPYMPSVFIESLIAIGETRWIDEIRAAAHKVIAADFSYPEFDPRHALGRVETWIGNRDEAIRWFAEARRVRTEQGAHPHVALVNLHEAEAELRLGGSPTRITELLNKARPELERIDATARVNDCDRIQAAL